MATFYPSITAEQKLLIERSRLFFVATADPELRAGPQDEGAINMSPKGGVTLHVLGPNRVAFLDFGGSGNETARHTAAGSAITLAVLSFDENAAIVRLYGRAVIVPLAESALAPMLLADAADEINKPRQVFEIDVTRTMTSCGYGVPVMTHIRDRKKADRGRRFKG